MTVATETTSRALQIVRKYHPGVRMVRDAEQSVYVEVDGRTARHASPKPDDCPLARASRMEMELDGALVSRGIVYLIRGTVAERYSPTVATRRTIVAYDKTGEFPPGVYKLNPPDPTQTLEAMRNLKGGKPPSGTPKPRTWLKKGLRRRLNG